MNAGRLFDELRDRFDIKSDSAFARELDVNPSAISKARATNRVSDALVLRIHEYLVVPVKEVRALATESVPTTRKTHERTTEGAGATSAAAG